MSLLRTLPSVLGRSSHRVNVAATAAVVRPVSPTKATSPKRTEPNPIQSS